MWEKLKPPALCHKARLRLMIGTAGLLAAAALASSVSAQACDLAVRDGPQTVRIEYNPFAIGPSAGALDVGLENRGEAACDVRMSFTDDIGLEVTSVVLGNVGVQFRPREASGVQMADVQTAVFQYQLPAGAKGQAQFDAAVVQGAVADAGEYGVNLRLVMKTADGEPIGAPIPVRLILQATPRAQLNLAGAAGAFGTGSSVEVVDFGEAIAGVTRRIFLQVRANTLATVSIASQHGGVMHRVEEAPNAPTLPYTVELAGDDVDLSALWTKQIDPPRTLAGISIPMTFVLGPVAGAMEGRYADVLTIDISPK
ncbi:hypothetical protein [Brevundimonas naejangsanensis]|uniref:hypothetical protein n=1 Tax=Brevundimonas naejangsanensis TaxID=588932 RepID=UPI0039F6E983